MNRRTNKKSIVPSRQEQIDIVKDTNEVAVYLYNYYVSIAYEPNRNLLDDKLIARAIGWTASKVKKNRLKLTHAGWIYFHQRQFQGIKYATWVFGKDLVIDFKLRAPDVPDKIKSEVYNLIEDASKEK